MPDRTVNGVRLRYELAGSGESALVLVHGSWGSHRNWDRVVPGLAESFRVARYDRRGHGDSESPPGPGSVREDVGDLAGLIEQLGIAPAYVVGNSFGGAIALRLTAERPGLVRGLVLHEPPLVSLLAGDAEATAILGEVGAWMAAVVEALESGNHTRAAEDFMARALAPGEWERLPEEFRQTTIDNAPTFLDEARDPEALVFAARGGAPGVPDGWTHPARHPPDCVRRSDHGVHSPARGVTPRRSARSRTVPRLGAFVAIAFITVPTHVQSAERPIVQDPEPRVGSGSATGDTARPGRTVVTSGRSPGLVSGVGA